MPALVTGMNGTVAPALGRALAGIAVTAWDRTAVPIDDDAAARDFLRRAQPDVFYHIATVPPEWAERCARLCAELDIGFVFTGSVSVFSARQHGPFAPDDDYGRYKLDCERRIRAAHAGARIVRLGWQIGATDESFVLRQNYPNPFGPSTRIQFELREAAEVSLEVFDVRGRRVAVMERAQRGPGQHTFVWDGNDANGRSVASGVYLYTLTVGEASETRKVLLMR